VNRVNRVIANIEEVARSMKK